MMNFPKPFFKKRKKIKNTLISLFQLKTEDNKINNLKLNKNFLSFIEIKIIVRCQNKSFTNYNPTD